MRRSVVLALQVAFGGGLGVYGADLHGEMAALKKQAQEQEEIIRELRAEQAKMRDAFVASTQTLGKLSERLTTLQAEVITGDNQIRAILNEREMKLKEIEQVVKEMRTSQMIQPGSTWHLVGVESAVEKLPDRVVNDLGLVIVFLAREKNNLLVTTRKAHSMGNVVARQVVDFNKRPAQVDLSLGAAGKDLQFLQGFADPLPGIWELGGDGQLQICVGPTAKDRPTGLKPDGRAILLTFKRNDGKELFQP